LPKAEKVVQEADEKGSWQRKIKEESAGQGGTDERRAKEGLMRGQKRAEGAQRESEGGRRGAKASVKGREREAKGTLRGASQLVMEASRR